MCLEPIFHFSFSSTTITINHPAVIRGKFRNAVKPPDLARIVSLRWWQFSLLEKLYKTGASIWKRIHNSHLGRIKPTLFSEHWLLLNFFRPDKRLFINRSKCKHGRCIILSRRWASTWSVKFRNGIRRFSIVSVSAFLVNSLLFSPF